MDTYYNNMHMYGSVPKGKGVDRNMNQFYGRKSLGNASLGGVATDATVLGILGAVVIGSYVVDGLLMGYMVGSNDSKREVARRSAIVGTLVGIPSFILLMGMNA